MSTTTEAAVRPSAAEDRSFFGHPRGLSTLFFTEMWERFSYYGIRPLLVLFMAAALNQGGFGIERDQASAIVGIYAASVYLASLPGGWIADRLLGLRRAIMLGAVLISLGHIAIGTSSFLHARAPFFLGLIFIVLGTGLLKPNISAIVGDLYPEGGARRDAGFSIFYVGINSGAFFGQIMTGLLGEGIGWHWGFGIAGVGMLAGLAWFALRSRATLGNLGLDIVRDPDPVKQTRQQRIMKLVLAAGLGLMALVFVLGATGRIHLDPQAIGEKMTYVLVAIAALYFAYVLILGGLNVHEKKRIVVIAILFVFAAIFWAAFEQAPTSLNLFAKDFTNRGFFGWEIPAIWFQSVNSVFIILLAPVFASIWLRLGSRGQNPSSPAKFAMGLLFAAIGFAVMIPAANILVGSGGTVKVSPWWLVVSYFFQTLGELSLSPVGLSSMTKLSPRKYVGQMMGIWFLATSVGNLIAGLVGGHVDPKKLEQTPKLFIGTTVALVAAAILLGLMVPFIRKLIPNEDKLVGE
ncbi:MAG TPA: peptide MFS transporter [Pyrinomonadaceae bacterium]|jgi:POT family proton-dependent oligopeptide transporter|nr:peptide MFS transporter [Pyrinomonadaceae bacterium]